MQLINFSPTGWESWDLSRQPLIRDRMPVLIDGDLHFGTRRGCRGPP